MREIRGAYFPFNGVTRYTSGTCDVIGCFSSGSRELSRLAKFPTGFGPVVIFVVSGFGAPIFLGAAAYGKKVPTHFVRHFVLNWSGLVKSPWGSKRPQVSIRHFGIMFSDFLGCGGFVFLYWQKVPPRSERHFSFFRRHGFVLKLTLFLNRGIRRSR